MPGGYAPATATPLVLVLHGGGGDAERTIDTTGFNTQADQVGFIAVYPNGSGALQDKVLTWNGGNCCGYAQKHNIDDTAFIKALIEELSATYKIDPKRIYATGLSNGAIMAYRLACEMSGTLAAIAPVAGTQNVVSCQPEQPVSVIHFHGTNDQHLPYDGGVGKRSITGVAYQSVQDSVNFWVRQDACPLTPTIEKTGHITRSLYASCGQNSAVELITVEEGGHAWPGGRAAWSGGDEPTQEISATAVMWDFFAAHPKP
jgi:polyhydroxybutyrate depolymerase